MTSRAAPARLTDRRPCLPADHGPIEPSIAAPASISPGAVRKCDTRPSSGEKGTGCALCGWCPHDANGRRSAAGQGEFRFAHARSRTGLPGRARRPVAQAATATSAGPLPANYGTCSPRTPTRPRCTTSTPATARDRALVTISLQCCVVPFRPAPCLGVCRPHPPCLATVPPRWRAVSPAVRGSRRAQAVHEEDAALLDVDGGSPASTVGATQADGRLRVAIPPVETVLPSLTLRYGKLRSVTTSEGVPR